MIDIKELRRMAQAATPGPWIVNAAAITELLDRLEAAEKERDALRAKIAEMEKQEPVAEWLPLDSGEDTRRD